MKTEEEILRECVPADCIWEESKHLVNTPFEYVFEAMRRYHQELKNEENHEKKV